VKRLLQAAVDLYSVKGFAGASILESLAADVKQGRYSHFESKAKASWRFTNRFHRSADRRRHAIMEKGLPPAQTIFFFFFFFFFFVFFFFFFFFPR